MVTRLKTDSARSVNIRCSLQGLDAGKRQALNSLNLDFEPLRDKTGRPRGLTGNEASMSNSLAQEHGQHTALPRQ